MATHGSLLVCPRAAISLRAALGVCLLGRTTNYPAAHLCRRRAHRRFSFSRSILSSRWSHASVVTGGQKFLVKLPHKLENESTIGERRHMARVVARVGLHSDVEIVEEKSQAVLTPPTFQQAIQRLQDYWASVGCAVMQSSNTEVGAGTMNPATFLRVLGPEPWNVAYAEPSIRPDDSRYGENPNRVQRHTQFQVILKPDPGNSQELYLGSLAALGINVTAHDIRFVEDNWESPVLGAWGLGWEVWMDGMEITQFTYFQQVTRLEQVKSTAAGILPPRAGSLPLSPVSVEITYGLERIMMSLQGVDHFKKIQYAPGITYGELFLENEKEMSTYNLDLANVERIQKRFALYAEEAEALLKQGLAIPAYDNVLKTSHAFNLLDARGAVGVTERARFFGRMRTLARHCAQLWVETRERLNYPLGVWEEPLPVVVSALDPKLCQIACPEMFVLEIGSEELPPQDVVSAISQLEVAFPQSLKSWRLQHGKLTVYATPRRLVVLVEDLAPRQDDEVKEMRGPPTAKAYDADGRPTKAAEGFCNRNGVKLEDLIVKQDGKAEFVYARVKEQSKSTLEVLAEGLPGIISKITFPKAMRWNSQVSYSRPLRWIVALYGEAVIPFSYAGVTSDRTSRLLRAASSPSLQIHAAGDYVSSLSDAGIMLSMEERRENIWAEGSNLAATIQGRIPAEARAGLLDEVANLVEAPAPLLGSFDEAFLRLPSDVLTTVMRKHQRYFPVVSESSGQLLPAFIAVANGKVDQEIVRKGNEAVLRARYEDAKFFYEADTSRKLAEYRPLLQGITFQEKLGSMLDKSKRIEKVVRVLGSAMYLDETSIKVAEEAAPLASADLATAMVMEFTNLAGIMGKHYAAKEGYSSTVQEAIFESVLPRHAEDILPRSNAGVLLAVADRLDSLVGLFAVGCQPTASADPFGLRRNVYGLVQAIVENDKQLNLDEAFKIVACTLPVHVSESTLKEVAAFVTRRLEQLLVDDGANVELVRSVLSERSSLPALAARSVSQMEELAKGNVLADVVAAYARPDRMVRGKDIDPSWQVDEACFEVDEERALWEAYKQTAEQLSEGVGVDVFIHASQALVDPLEQFFGKVFVMAEDERLRKNRLAMLNNIASLSRGIVDLSVLPGF